MQPATSSDRIRFDRPAAGLQRLRARFGGHAFDLHRHETYAVGLTLWGAQSFHYCGSLRTSRAGQIMIIRPDEAHDGHAGADQGFGYSMLYVEPGTVSAALEGASPPFVPEVVTNDPILAGLLDEAFSDFPAQLEPLAQDALVGRLAEQLACRSDGKRPRASAIARRAVTIVPNFLDAEANRTVASEELERLCGFDRFALAWHFRAVHGTSPHRYQVGRRPANAQRLIAEGMKPAETAAAAGFADQSHLTRRFAARFGLTPGRWAALARA